jgi:hypothetical protein
MTITLSDHSPRESYTVAQGVTQTEFTVPFEFFDDADLNFYVDGTKKDLTTHYTVSGGNGANGTINTTSGNSVVGISGGSTVVITRSIALNRTTDFPSSGAFDVAKLNRELDRFTAIADDITDTVTRSLQLADEDSTATMTLPTKANRLGTLLGFNATTGAAEAGPTIANVSTLSAITGNINTLGGISADITTLAHLQDGTTATNALSNLNTKANDISTVANIHGNVTTVANNLTAINNASDNATKAQNYATKVDGEVPNTSDYSAKAQAVGGTNVTNVTGSAKEWALGGGTNPSATVQVNSNGEYSAKGYAIGAINRGASANDKHSAKDWATYTAGTVDGTLFSAKYYAQQAETNATSFSNVYQGTHASDPSGGTVSAGDLYYNSTSQNIKFYNGSAWVAIEAVDTSTFSTKGFATAMAVAL